MWRNLVLKFYVEKVSMNIFKIGSLVSLSEAVSKLSKNGQMGADRPPGVKSLLLLDLNIASI